MGNLYIVLNIGRVHLVLPVDFGITYDCVISSIGLLQCKNREAFNE